MIDPIHRLNYSNTRFSYANETRVVPTSDEVAFDFVVRPLPGDAHHGTFERIFVNYFTAKRLCSAIHVSISRHEGAFGHLTVGGFCSRNSLGSPLKITYSNFCRMSGTPEEIIVDFGINSQPDDPKQFFVHTQVSMLYPTLAGLAKQLADVLNAYEAKHGILETDVRKRVSAPV